MKAKKANADIDEQNEGVSYEKGREFEKKFAEFMKQELGWSKVRVGAHMSGHHNAKGTSIDVFGERLDELGIKYRKISMKWMWGSAALSLLALIWFLQDWANNGFWFLIMGMMSMLGCGIFMMLSDANNKQNAWVECKNLQSRANINHISKMVREYEDFKSSGNKDHRFTHLYFASANGYVENAMKAAMVQGIVCYEKKGRTFVKVDYWDETKKQ